jgi:hypothetical protein
MKRRLLLLGLVLISMLAAVEVYRAYRFYAGLSDAKAALLSIKDDLALSELNSSESEVVARQTRLLQARQQLDGANAFTDDDPLFNLARPLPVIGKQAQAMKVLIDAAIDSTAIGLTASEVALEFVRYEGGEQTSIEKALDFLVSQEARMAEAEAGLARLQQAQAKLPHSGLIAPLSKGARELDDAVTKLEGLIEGYNRANQFLPELLGRNGPRSYLLLNQNDTELFPSGGLISSYGVVHFEGGRLMSLELEYFGTLFDRWQATGPEYVEPPAPLRRYLKREFSWGLGEAGWYPDFPTTARIARDFVTRGGVPYTDGTIAIDFQFVRALLDLVGPIEVRDYGVTVTAANVEELSLELTRDEDYVQGQPNKVFLSFLARDVLNRLFAVPKEKWVDLMRLLDRMGRERHLQFNFEDARLQALSRDYGFDGAMVETTGDYLLLADASVNSTKLNLILETSAQVDVEMMESGDARTFVTYAVSNPFPEWEAGRDPRLVEALMIGGVYGCYLRVYAPSQARLANVRIDGQPVGTEQAQIEVGKMAFGRFFLVLPGASTQVQFHYETQGVIEDLGGGRYVYRLYIQKEAGTKALPIELRYALPSSALLDRVLVDGAEVEAGVIVTDLATDRVIEVFFQER